MSGIQVAVAVGFVPVLVWVVFTVRDETVREWLRKQRFRGYFARLERRH